jgi:hypothetical protein
VPAATPGAQPISIGESATPKGEQPAPAALASGQPAEAKPDKPTEQQPPSATTEQQVAKKAEDDIKAFLGFAETSAQKKEREDRQHAATVQEAKRLNQTQKKLEEILKAQGLDLVMENGEPSGLAPNKAYNKDAPDFDVDFEKLTEAEQELFVESPKKAIKLVLERAKQAFVRAMPTIDRVTAPVSPETEAVTIDEISKEILSDGIKKRPDLAENLVYVKQLLEMSDHKKALREFYNQAPKLALELLSDHIHYAKQTIKDINQRVIEAQKQKEILAAQKPPFGPASGGAASIGGEKSTDSIGHQIAHASRGY